jgi:hypothetical protein
LAIGNGTAGDFSGSLKLKSVLITDTAANTDLTVQNTTTATSSTTNASPLLEIAANYWTGSASAADTWTIGSSLAAGTNGASTLTFAHSGSTGLAAIQFPTSSVLQWSTNTGLSRYTSGQVAIGNGTAGDSSGALVCYNILTNIFDVAYNYAGVSLSSGTPLSWASGAFPAALDTGLSRISAGVVGIGTGAQGSVAGTLECAAIVVDGATVKSGTINIAGSYYCQGTIGVTQTAEAVGTIATTGGIVTTFTAVSDERLKISQEYKGGLDEILQIQPIKYRWNKTGHKYSGQSTERDFIGFSAQNVQKSIPEAVWVSKDDYLGFEDRPVIAALVNAVKELKAEIEVLKARK